MTYTLKSASSEWTAFCLEIIPDPSKPFAHPIVTYVTVDRADGEAKKISSLLPDADIRLTAMARIKAIYRKGERVKQFDYRDFYILSDEEYARTRIPDSQTVELF